MESCIFKLVVVLALCASVMPMFSRKSNRTTASTVTTTAPKNASATVSTLKDKNLTHEMLGDEPMTEGVQPAGSGVTRHRYKISTLTPGQQYVLSVVNQDKGTQVSGSENYIGQKPDFSSFRPVNKEFPWCSFPYHCLQGTVCPTSRCPLGAFCCRSAMAICCHYSNTGVEAPQDVSVTEAPSYGEETGYSNRNSVNVYQQPDAEFYPGVVPARYPAAAPLPSPAPAPYPEVASYPGLPPIPAPAAYPGLASYPGADQTPYPEPVPIPYPAPSPAPYQVESIPYPVNESPSYEQADPYNLVPSPFNPPSSSLSAYGLEDKDKQLLREPQPYANFPLDISYMESIVPPIYSHAPEILSPTTILTDQRESVYSASPSIRGRPESFNRPSHFIHPVFGNAGTSEDPVEGLQALLGVDNDREYPQPVQQRPVVFPTDEVDLSKNSTVVNPQNRRPSINGILHQLVNPKPSHVQSVLSSYGNPVSAPRTSVHELLEQSVGASGNQPFLQPWISAPSIRAVIQQPTNPSSIRQILEESRFASSYPINSVSSSNNIPYPEFYSPSRPQVYPPPSLQAVPRPQPIPQGYSASIPESGSVYVAPSDQRVPGYAPSQGFPPNQGYVAPSAPGARPSYMAPLGPGLVPGYPVNHSSVLGFASASNQSVGEYTAPSGQRGGPGYTGVIQGVPTYTAQNVPRRGPAPSYPFGVSANVTSSVQGVPNYGFASSHGGEYVAAPGERRGSRYNASPVQGAPGYVAPSRPRGVPSYASPIQSLPGYTSAFNQGGVGYAVPQLVPGYAASANLGVHVYAPSEHQPGYVAPSPRDVPGYAVPINYGPMAHVASPFLGNNHRYPVPRSPYYPGYAASTNRGVQGYSAPSSGRRPEYASAYGGSRYVAPYVANGESGYTAPFYPFMHGPSVLNPVQQLIPYSQPPSVAPLIPPYQTQNPSRYNFLNPYYPGQHSYIPDSLYPRLPTATISPHQRYVNPYGSVLLPRDPRQRYPYSHYRHRTPYSNLQHVGYLPHRNEYRMRSQG